MKSLVLWALIALNALLLISFLGRVITPNAAMAQPAGGAGTGAAAPAGNAPRRPGDYLMIPGEVPGGTTSLVYVVDTTNGWLGAMAFDDTRSALDTMPKIDMNRAFDSAMQQRVPTAAPAGPNNPRGGPGRTR